MIHVFNYPEATTMHDGMCARLFLGTQEGVDYDHVHGTDVMLHNVVLDCDRFEWEYDLNSLWLARGRWNTMVRQYIDRTSMDVWLQSIQAHLAGRGKRRGIAVLRTNTVQGHGNGRATRRRWGSCMLTMSYRVAPYPQVTLHSRTTYFGYLAALDITVAHKLATEAAHLTGLSVEDVRFVWNLEMAQFHGFRSLAWPLGDDEYGEMLDSMVDHRTTVPYRGTDARPGLRKALDGYARLMKSDREMKLYGDEAFSSFCRVRRRFHTQIRGYEYAQQFADSRVGAFQPLPPLSTEDLDLTPIGYHRDSHDV